STAPEMKSAKAAGKRKIPLQAASGLPDTAPEGQSNFENALRAAQEELAEKLESEAWNCEVSTREAVLAAQPTEKLSAFHSGFEGWGNKVCAAATEYYN